MSSTLRETSLKLEDIRSLSDEVRLLVEAGLPLERHLVEAGSGHGSKLQAVTQSITDGLNRGHSLEQVIDHNGGGASRMLASAVAAGVRTGSLAATIEMMGDFASDLVDLRRQILQAITYPVIVMVMAWALFAIVIQHALSRVFISAQQLGISLHPVLTQLLQWNMSWSGWVWLFPVPFVVLLGWWVMSGRASSMVFRGPERLLLLLPGVRSLVRDLRFYTLTRMLSLLVEKQVPLPDALLLAGAASGSHDLDTVCQQSAESIRRGNPAGTVSGAKWRRGQLPPLLHVCLGQTAKDESRLLIRLRAVAEHYRERLRLSVLWLKMVLPVALFVVIGGGAVVLYATTVFWPVIEIYRRLSDAM